jgi:hypothetical protein
MAVISDPPGKNAVWTVPYPADGPSQSADGYELENNELREQLKSLQGATASVLFHWRQFEDPPHDTKKQLFQAYVKSGGKVS